MDEKPTAGFQETTERVEVDRSAEFHEAKVTKKLMLIVFSTSLSHFTFGFDTSYINFAISSQGNDLDGKPLTSTQTELVTSATSLGALIGSAMTSWLADSLGRKGAMLVANVFLAIGAILQTACSQAWLFGLGRGIMGLGVGIGSGVTSVSLSEMAPQSTEAGLRVFAAAVGAGLSNVPHAGWRILVGISLIPVLVQSVALFFLPDTPRFLVQKGRIEEAKQVIYQTHGGVPEEVVDLKIEELIEAVKETYPEGTTFIQRNMIKLRDLHKIPSNFRALVLVCGMQGINTITGYNSLLYYASVLYGAVGFEDADAVSIIIAATNFVFTLVVYFLIDRFGRRTLMLQSLTGMMLSMAACSVGFHFLNIKFDGDDAKITTTGNNIPPAGIVVVVFMTTFVAFYATGAGTVPWSSQSEFFPMATRSLGTSFAVCTNWAGNLIISGTFLTQLKNMTPTGTFGFYAGICAVSLAFIFILFPELSNLGLEETQLVLSDGFNVKKSKQMSKARKRLASETVQNEKV